jgi:hypothetical protein
MLENKPTKYTGPTKPVPTEPKYFKATDVAWRVALLLTIIGVLAYDLLIGRPG